ncbi:MAG: methylenetetrahydrofolate dehydrogenase, partial [Candidatus Altiarchaeales archaeon HGW-Altiarchaeales-2]
IWSKYDFVKILADVNAYPPYGIEGVEANDDCKEIEGRTGIGALRIGTIKNKAQKAIIRKLFEKKGNILKLEDIYAAAFE